MTKTTEKEKTRGYGTYDNPRQNKKTHTQHKTHRRNAAMETTNVVSRNALPKLKKFWTHVRPPEQPAIRAGSSENTST